MIFSDSPQQKALERMMTAVPKFRPKGGGIMVLHRFEYTAEMCDCRYCPYYRGKRKCTAEVVKTVFGLYRDGNSLEGIQNYLFSQGIPSPSGKAQWSRDVLNKLLNNGKYTKGIIKFEEYCDVYFLKGENCRNPNQAKVVKTYAESDQRGIRMGIRPDQREVSGACE